MILANHGAGDEMLANHGAEVEMLTNHGAGVEMLANDGAGVGMLANHGAGVEMLPANARRTGVLCSHKHMKTARGTPTVTSGARWKWPRDG